MIRSGLPTAATLCVTASVTQRSYWSRRPSTRLSSGLHTCSAAKRRRECSLLTPAFESRSRSPYLTTTLGSSLGVVALAYPLSARAAARGRSLMRRFDMDVLLGLYGAHRASRKNRRVP